MQYISTRSNRQSAPSAQAIVGGICADGGLYVPDHFPKIALSQIGDMAQVPYYARAKQILGAYLTDYSAQELEDCCRQAYTPPRFDTADIAPVVKANGTFSLELYHGPTQAFKDMALQMLPRLMTLAIPKTGMEQQVAILVATSGDTGKAALEGFADVPGTHVVVFYPDGGVSPAQRQQMVTQRGGNVHVAAVRGNFDDTQTGVKRIFADQAFAKEMDQRGYALSSANSINWGRLVPQVAYYFSAYADLVDGGHIKLGDLVNFCVPTGNFGNILAGYYAKRMGLPVGKLICASNQNNVLADFVNTGVYDANRAFYRTSSPSMDILISSNVERLLYDLVGRDPAKVAAMMDSLKASGRYELPDSAKKAFADEFYGAWATDEQGDVQIKRMYEDYGYLIDPHTAIGYAVLEGYRARTGDKTPTVVISTASPYKFAGRVLSVLSGALEDDEYRAADALCALSGVAIPEPLKAMRQMPVRHSALCDKGDMMNQVSQFLL